MRFSSISVGVLVCLANTLQAQVAEDEIVYDAAVVLREIMAIPARGIPEALLHEAEGIAIIPGLLKGGFVVGIKHGKGIVMIRDDEGNWRSPVFITATGGSIGWQVGLQSTDVILVIRNRRGVEGLMQSKFTIGADASVAAGPIGREAAAATDLNLKAEILSYSRSRGLFAGVAIDGAVIQADQKATNAYYGRTPGQLPITAMRLMEQVAFYTGAVKAAPAVVQDAQAAPPAPQPADSETLRRQLADTSKRLQTIVDAQWRQYLALPQEVYAEGKAPPPEVLETFVKRYNTVAGDRQYQPLTSRPEFQEVHGLLNRYYQTLQPRAPEAVRLPPPPG